MHTSDNLVGDQISMKDTIVFATAAYLCWAAFVYSISTTPRPRFYPSISRSNTSPQKSVPDYSVSVSTSISAIRVIQQWDCIIKRDPHDYRVATKDKRASWTNNGEYSRVSHITTPEIEKKYTLHASKTILRVIYTSRLHDRHVLLMECLVHRNCQLGWQRCLLELREIVLLT